MSTTAIDYDSPRGSVTETESLDLLQSRWTGESDEADFEFADDYALLTREATDEELTAPVVPIQTNEFRCCGCFLVLRVALRAGTRNGHDVCRECA